MNQIRGWQIPRTVEAAHRRKELAIPRLQSDSSFPCCITNPRKETGGDWKSHFSALTKSVSILRCFQKTLSMLTRTNLFNMSRKTLSSNDRNTAERLIRYVDQECTQGVTLTSKGCMKLGLSMAPGERAEQEPPWHFQCQLCFE